MDERMTYKEFHDCLKWALSEWEITAIQEYAFQNYEEAHGRRPEKKEEKQLAYDFITDYLRGMEIAECTGCLKPLGIPLMSAARLWHGLEEI